MNTPVAPENYLLDGVFFVVGWEYYLQITVDGFVVVVGGLKIL